MLAKYIPGGVWTPAARVVALRRFGVRETPVVLATILLEAGLSALAGVGVFVVGLALIGGADAPLLPLARLRRPARRAALPAGVRPRGRSCSCARSAPRRWHRCRRATAFELLAFYALTWPLGGLSLFFLLRSVGGDPELIAIPFLGGASAVGAIVAVLVVFAPSGLGVREASVYGLLLAIVSEGVALGAIVLNRLAITVVEAALLLVGLLLLRRHPAIDDPEADVPGRVSTSRAT